MTAAELIADWASLNDKKNKLFETNRGVFTRWLANAQQSHCEKSEIIRKSQSVYFSADGRAGLPQDFIRVKGKPLWNDSYTLELIGYDVANGSQITGTYFYAIHDGAIYVFGESSGTMTLTYVANPNGLYSQTLNVDDLELMSREVHETLLIYLDAQWARSQDDISGYNVLMDKFSAQAKQDGWNYSMQVDSQPVLESNFF